MGSILHCRVAPHVGAWIETERWLLWIQNIWVAPHVGAWIETPPSIPDVRLLKVAPHVGAWIETLARSTRGSRWASHPMWVRGLKLRIERRIEPVAHVAPHVGAWIETELEVETVVAAAGTSHPMWVRGLKLLNPRVLLLKTVAPHVGAWIETKDCGCVRRKNGVAPHVGAWIETLHTRRQWLV